LSHRPDWEATTTEKSIAPPAGLGAFYFRVYLDTVTRLVDTRIRILLRASGAGFCQGIPCFASWFRISVRKSRITTVRTSRTGRATLRFPAGRGEGFAEPRRRLGPIVVPARQFRFVE